MRSETLASFPYVVVRVRCAACGRQGSYRLARLAAKYGADIAMPDLLAQLAGDCKYWDQRKPGALHCQARFADLDPPRRPPDLPAARLRLVKG
jgi:hypothetical protein